MSARYRSKSVEVDAIQWTGSNVDAMIAFAAYDFQTVDPQDRDDDPDMTASVLEGTHSTWVPLYDGTWVVRDEDGLHAVAEDDFAKTYEPMETSR